MLVFGDERGVLVDGTSEKSSGFICDCKLVKWHCSSWTLGLEFFLLLCG